MKIWAHTLVKNEERYVWYSIMSVIDYVDKILVWDTGSVDNTVEIIKQIKKRFPEKIDFKEFGEVDINQFTLVRQKMLKETKSDWFIILDGDEVWWEDSISQVKSVIEEKGKHLDSIVSRHYNIVGDIYHFQDEIAGGYVIDGKRGFLNIRATNRGIPGINFSKPHGQQGIFDGNGVLIQEREKQKKVFIDKCSYLHFTNVLRSKSLEKDILVPKRKMKLKYELGHSFPKDFYYPEVFFRPRPLLVPNIWEKMNAEFLTRSIIETPLRMFKRKFVKNRKTGY